MDGMLSSGRTQNFSIVAIVFGFMLVIAAAMSGTTMLIAFYNGITTIHTLSDIRINVIRVLFNFITPLVGGIILVMAGTTILHFDAHATQRRIVRAGRVKFVKEKEHMIGSMLSNDERYVLDMVGGGSEGVLQSDLVLKSNFSKVKMHRILKKLENKELIRRVRFGITNRVALVNR
jgi:hypothetical protein